MKNYISHRYIAIMALVMMACQSEDLNAMPPADNDNQTNSMNITINGNTASCKLVDNVATSALLERLAEGDVTYSASEYGGFEMVGSVGFSLPTTNTQTTTEAGDVVLYNGNSICIFVGSNSWSYTRLGKIEGMTTSELRSFLNIDQGRAVITLSLNTDVTGIKRISDNSEQKDTIYDMNGRRLEKEPAKGMYIKNGQKIFK